MTNSFQNSIRLQCRKCLMAVSTVNQINNELFYVSYFNNKI